jgi:hypothetical protein
LNDSEQQSVDVSADGCFFVLIRNISPVAPPVLALAGDAAVLAVDFSACARDFQAHARNIPARAVANSDVDIIKTSH